MTEFRRAPRAPWMLAAACAGGLLLAGCGSGTTSTAGATPTSGAATPSASSSAGSSAGSSATGEVTITDTWVRATEGTSDPTMTAAFGVLTNHTDQQRTVVSATNSASDHTELHEMAMDNGAMVMRPVAGGITVPADGTTTLGPGGLHVMVMNLTSPIKPGDEVSVVLTLDDGSTVPFTAVAKEFAGAQESYSPSTGAGMGGMDMGTSAAPGSDMGAMTSGHG
ncbi:copper chaperone PCu(A)C [Nakamurella sp.]|uniref:copper chaperone PCu(A)C n=1 Tax=Nakamurella sp. TaxID=1869182 RepID=UPI003B3A929E